MNNLQKSCSEDELRQAIEDFIRYYNEARYRARYGYHSPSEVRAAALASTDLEQFPISDNPRIRKYKAKYVA